MRKLFVAKSHAKWTSSSRMDGELGVLEKVKNLRLHSVGWKRRGKQGLKSGMRPGLCQTRMGAAACVSTRQGLAQPTAFSRTITLENQLHCGFGDPFANGLLSWRYFH